jgi:hypothetical protein
MSPSGQEEVTTSSKSPEMGTCPQRVDRRAGLGEEEEEGLFLFTKTLWTRTRGRGGVSQG